MEVTRKKIKMGFLLGLLIGILGFGGIKLFSKKNKKQKITAIEFVSQLKNMGYFQYADQEHVVRLQENFIENYDPDNELVSIWDDSTAVPLDYRYYWCDGETVFEQGGFIELLEQLQPTFTKIGLKISVSDHFEEWDSTNEWLNHRITINGSEYIIFENFKGYGWGEAVLRFAQIINQEAEKQSLKERIYLVSGGNDGRVIFLTPDLYDYIYSVYQNDQWKPLEISEWMRVMGVKPIN